jgi:hypothetical protein
MAKKTKPVIDAPVTAKVVIGANNTIDLLGALGDLEQARGINSVVRKVRSRDADVD